MFRNLIAGASVAALPSTPPAQHGNMTGRTFMTSVVLGPLVGGMVAWATLTAYAFLSPLTPGHFEVWGWASLIVVAVPVGYILGFFPSLVAGAINAGLASTPIPSWLRVVLAVPIGIATTWLVWFWLILGMPSHNLAIYAAIFTAAGAVGSPAAVWWATRPCRAGPVPQSEVPA